MSTAVSDDPTSPRRAPAMTRTMRVLGRTRVARLRIAALVLASGVALFAAVARATEAAASPSLQVTGSSFAGIAFQQWVGESATLYGLNINWQVSSSVIGLDNFAQNQIDFGASDIPYSSGQATSLPNAPYQYMPDVAGALAFMYNVNGLQTGQPIKNLVLTPQLIEGIFSGHITTWNDPEIAKFNPQLAGNLPPTKILAVYRVDAAGENYLLSDYLLHMDGSDFSNFQNAMQAGIAVGQPSASWPSPGQNPNLTNYPGWSAGDMIGQNGSDNAANYVAAASSNGAITYVETAYAISHNDPVASVVNQAGNAVQPTSVNDATALEKAVLYADLTQNLTGVYTNTLPNAYPVSSYSYVVTPCSPALAAAQKPPTKCSGPSGSTSFPPAKGQALGQFVDFLACAGQDQMAQLGYSPLPPNLVQEDFNAIGRLPGGQDPGTVTSTNCKNPYVDGQTPLPGEPSVIGQPHGTPGGGPGPNSGGGGNGGGGSTGGGGSHGSSGPPGTGSGSQGGGPTGTTGGGKSGSRGASGSHGTSPTGNPSLSGANKYLAHHKGTSASGPNSFLRANELRAAAFSALGFASPVVEIIAWCAVFAGAILVPVLALVRRRRRGANRPSVTAPAET